MGKFILVTGGARSGKSVFSENTALKLGKEFTYIATMQGKDGELKERIKSHQSSRSRVWKTIEEPVNVFEVLKKEDKKGKVILIDCLTLLVSNWMFKNYSMKKIGEKSGELAEYCKNAKSSIVIVTNEVGMGVVPVSKMGRYFRDAQGKANQIMAKNADKVYFMVSGLPMKLKS